MKLGSLVLWQQTEISDTTVTFIEAPAVVTYIGQRPKTLGSNETVEVVSLTVFREGSIEYVRDVQAYNDDLGRQPGAHSYRDPNAERPQVKLDKSQPPQPQPAQPRLSPAPDTTRPSGITTDSTIPGEPDPHTAEAQRWQEQERQRREQEAAARTQTERDKQPVVDRPTLDQTDRPRPSDRPTTTPEVERRV